MRLVWLHVFNVPNDEAFSICFAEDLSSFGYFQRGFVREHLTFAARTSSARCPPGSRITIELKEVPVNCHVYRRENGLCGVAIADNEYQDRVAHSLISKILVEFERVHRNKWKGVDKDDNFEFKELTDMLAQYQKPEEADKMLHLQKNLDEIKDIMHKNIEEVLRRGETLDSLLNKSDDIGELSKLFHDKAKKNNQCCQWY